MKNDSDQDDSGSLQKRDSIERVVPIVIATPTLTVTNLTVKTIKTTPRFNFYFITYIVNRTVTLHDTCF